jgi:hypothetical protein
VDETGSGSRPVVGFGISGVDNSGSVTRRLNKDGSRGNTFTCNREVLSSNLRLNTEHPACLWFYSILPRNFQDNTLN